MMRYRSAARLFTILAFAFGIVPGALAQTSTTAFRGSGIGVAPAFLNVEDAQRNGSYSNSLILDNAQDSDVEFELTPEGDIASWVTFTDPDDRSKKLTSLRVAARQQGLARVQIDVPSDTANNVYTGRIGVLSRSVETVKAKGVGIGVGLGAAIELKVTVGGTEKRAGSLVDAAVAPVEVGMDVRFTARIRNEGNVVLKPIMRVAITRANTPTASLDTTKDLYPVDPGQTGEVVAVWKTGEQLGGDYVAEFSVLDDSGAEGLPLGTASVPFRLEPRGTFTRDGKMDSLELVNKPEVGGIAQIKARFMNTGRIETQAVFVGQLEVDGKIVRAIESVPRLARSNSAVDVGFAIDIAEAATYRVSGRINYEGRETPMRKVSFVVADVAEAAGGSSSKSSSKALLAGGVALTLAGVAVAYLIGVRRRH